MPQPETVPAVWPPSLPRAARRTRGLPRHPATLLEQTVHVAVQRRQRRVDRQTPADRLLTILEYLRRDLLPFRHLRQRDHAVELHAERPRMTIVGERRVVPGGAIRRQVACERVKTQL